MLAKRVFILIALSIIMLTNFSKGLHYLETIETGVNYQNEHALAKKYLKNSKNNKVYKRKTRLQKNNSSKQLTPEQIYEDADYVVKIKVFETVTTPFNDSVIPRYAGFGSGSIVKCEKYNFCVITAEHVIETPDAIFYAEFKDGSPPQKLKVISGNSKFDCAILKFSDPNFTPQTTATLGKSSKAEPGTMIVTIGSSAFGNFWINTGSLYVKSGPADEFFKEILKSIGSKYDRPSYLFISTPVFPGYSGGPIINKNGEVIGISTNVITLEESQTIYVGSPIDEVKSVLKIIK